MRPIPIRFDGECEFVVWRPHLDFFDALRFARERSESEDHDQIVINGDDNKILCVYRVSGLGHSGNLRRGKFFYTVAGSELYEKLRR